MKTDVIVIGGGHAGIEAANSAASLGVSVLLITGNVDLIGQMSCNPAIGGIAKGNIVREVDALGGLMGRIIDKAGIQFRMLNKSKGVAVWGNRAQADKLKYRTLCRKYLENKSNIAIFQDMVIKINVKNGRICGVVTESGESIQTSAIVLAMGTFLNGLAHIGMNSFSCGRAGEPASLQLSESIQEQGIDAGRLKTGTPARLDRRTIDFSKLKAQEGDDNPWPFSYSTHEKIVNKIVCWELKTVKGTHDIIRENLDKSPLYAGKIKSIGPRYCPSIEDKVVRFGDRNGHTLFLEPEGLKTNEMYLNGFSTSLPLDIQVKMVRSLPGFENARMVRPAYAIEYDYFLPVQLYSTLESRKVENLYFAGQINGTSGYEEAACQGLVAGVNAAKKVKNREEVILGRETSYTGVLIDDLVTKGTQEPYRMFTSRAEYRLLLRQDNADERLMPFALKHGLIEQSLYNERKEVWEKRKKIKEALEEIKIDPETWDAINNRTELKQKTTAAELLKRPQVSIGDVYKASGMDVPERELSVTVEADIKYEGFINKQQKEIGRLKKIEETRIPEDIDYDNIEGLLIESQGKLKKIRPITLGQASRISGVTPADISVLIMYITNNIINVSRETMG
jgi:tRNA uridine 5-carboxymethylaminomethyl modification enzyme